ncbi:amine oxidase [Aeromicrobium sp. PE09-221]|nr:amine oxidase [Aeromicrobium sp. PE09-221]
MSKETVAVVGAGISGLTAAYLLREQYAVTLYEADDRLGGHAHTHTVGEDRVDTGFIVHNDRTYPLLRRLFAELGVAVRPTEMSMSIRCEGCGLEYAGGRGARGILAQRWRIADPRFARMLLDVKRFQRAALALLAAEDDLTYGEFLDRHDFGDHFVQHYAIPVVACVWSSGTATALDYPARYLFTFLRHHGFLSLKDSPQWFTVEGGSVTYVDAITARLEDCVVGTPVRAIARPPQGGADLTTDHGVEHVDHVVIATHADDALSLLADPSPEEKDVLGAFGYSRNEVTLHRDPSVLPEARDARSAWNYRMDGCAGGDHPPVVTYWMNRLQGIDERRPYLVTLNDGTRPAPGSAIARMTYTHPVYTPASVAAQARLSDLSTPVTAYAGAYHGWGFHEDGCRSGVAAAEQLGVTW